MKQYTKFVGLDVHKKTIAVAVADSKNRGCSITGRFRIRSRRSAV